MEADNLKYDPVRLKNELHYLPHSKRLAFSASCCERAYVNYELFFKLVHWGGPGVLRAALNKVWDFIDGSKGSLDDLSELEHKCESVTPDLDDFCTPDVDVQAAAAQEAAFMIRLLLRFCTDNQVSYGVRIANFARDTIDMYVQVLEKLDPADPHLDEKIAGHPLMIEEIRKQEADLSMLVQISTQTELHQFRRSATNLDSSNIGLQKGS